MSVDTIIIYRTNEGPVEVVSDDDGDAAMFTSHAHALRYVESNKLFQSGQAQYQIVELEM